MFTTLIAARPNVSLHSPDETSTFPNKPKFNLSENLKVQIKRVLNIELENKTLDEYIAQSFNIYEADPLYVFILPEDIQNKTVILRKSNFAEAIFPNVTTIRKLRKIAMQTRFLHNQALHDMQQDQKTTWKIDNYFKSKYEQFKLNAYNLGEADNLRIIQENVRTERNFMKFMDDLNSNRVENDESDSEGVGSIQVRSRTDPKFNYYEKLTTPSKHEKYENHKSTTKSGTAWSHSTPAYRNKTVSLDNQQSNSETAVNFPIKRNQLIGIREKFLPILANFDSLLFLTKTPKRIPPSTTPKPTTPKRYKDKIVHSYSFVTHYPQLEMKVPTTTPSNNYPTINLFSANPAYLANPLATEDPDVFRHIKDTWEVKFEVPNEIRDIIKQERQKLENITQTFNFGLKRHKWPVTKSRAAHRDSDVFIARANNPFGHSTKWSWR